MICPNPPSVMPMFRSLSTRSWPDNRSMPARATVPASPTSLLSSTSSSTACPAPRCSRSSSTFCKSSSPVAWSPQLLRSSRVMRLSACACSREKTRDQQLAASCFSNPCSSASISPKRFSATSMPALASRRSCADTAKSLALEESVFFWRYMAFCVFWSSRSAFRSNTRCSASVPLPKSMCARQRCAPLEPCVNSSAFSITSWSSSSSKDKSRLAHACGPCIILMASATESPLRLKALVTSAPVIADVAAEASFPMAQILSSLGSG
mmetsp:Transcript_136495/g.323269  ORF Transcript_136495/g.323269 Transcript_136495/m.323269 type:complete len:266 (-) Transcript_136495:8-805(-)